MRLLALLLVCSFVVFSLSGLTLLADDEIKEKVEKPAVKDDTKYDLTPKFYKGMMWKESMVVTNTQASSSNTRSDKNELTANVSVIEMNGNKPKKLKYKDYGGKNTYTKEYKDENLDGYTNEKVVKKDDTEFELDDDLRRTSFEVKAMLEFDGIYPSGNILGYAIPKDPVKVGDVWKSESLISMNLHLIDKKEKAAEMVVKNIESNFKLKEVKKTKDAHIAIIEWTGKFTIPLMQGVFIELTWKGETEFDLTNKRVNSTKCVTETKIGDRELKYECARELKYDTNEMPDNKPEVGPKTDDE